MKNTKQILQKAKLAIQKKYQNVQSDQIPNSNNKLSAFDLIPIQFTGMLEDHLFKQSRQIFDILKQQTDHDIEGLTYSQIKLDQAKQTYYQKVKSNIPKYYSLKPSDRQKHFQTEGQLYLQKMTLPIKQSNPQINSPCKIKIQHRQLTPMKNLQISKKQTLQNKKQIKKNRQNLKQKPQLNHQDFQKKNLQFYDQNIFSTPQKKQKINKSVKFFQFEFVKDFSQYKTPKYLETLQQYAEPLRQIQPSKKQQ